MKITAGKYKLKNLVFPKKGFRPTQQKVKQAMFNILGPEAVIGRGLDLCCGTGGLGLEALSRGALGMVFVDEDTRYVQENISAVLSSEDKKKVQVLKKPLAKFFDQNNQEFDFIFFDPPWSSDGLYQLALKQIGQSDILKKKGVLLCEGPKKQELYLPLTSIGEVSLYGYGATKLWIVRR